MITLKFTKKQIEWAVWLLEHRYGKLSPRELVNAALAEIVTDESNKVSMEVSTAARVPAATSPRKRKSSNINAAARTN